MNGSSVLSSISSLLAFAIVIKPNESMNSGMNTIAIP